MKKNQKEDCQSREIFLSTNSMTIPLLNLYEEFLNLFDESEKSFSSESNVNANQEDALKKIVDEVAKHIETSQEQPIPNASEFPNAPQPSVATF